MELKIDKFRHEYASQLNMYLNYFKAEVMQPDDNPPIGILLCTEKGDTLVKYATAGLDPKYLCTEVHDRTSNRGRNKKSSFLPQTIKDKSRLKKIAKKRYWRKKVITISFFASIVSSCQ